MHYISQTMTCIRCNGSVEWRGPLSHPSHTECLTCGGINCERSVEELPAACSLCDGFSEVDGDECAQCLGSGLSGLETEN